MQAISRALLRQIFPRAPADLMASRRIEGREEMEDEDEDEDSHRRKMSGGKKKARSLLARHVPVSVATIHSSPHAFPTSAEQRAYPGVPMSGRRADPPKEKTQALVIARGRRVSRKRADICDCSRRYSISPFKSRKPESLFCR